MHNQSYDPKILNCVSDLDTAQYVKGTSKFPEAAFNYYLLM